MDAPTIAPSATPLERSDLAKLRFGQDLRSLASLTSSQLIDEAIALLPQFQDPASNQRRGNGAMNRDGCLIRLPLVYALVERCMFDSVSEIEELRDHFAMGTLYAKKNCDMELAFNCARTAEVLTSLAKNFQGLNGCTTSASHLKHDYLLNKMKDIVAGLTDPNGQISSDRRDYDLSAIQYFLLTQAHLAHCRELVFSFFKAISPIRPDSNYAFYTHTLLLIDTIDAVTERTKVEIGENPADDSVRRYIGALALMAWEWLAARREVQQSRSCDGRDGRWNECVTRLHEAIACLGELGPEVGPVTELLNCPRWNEAVDIATGKSL